MGWAENRIFLAAAAVAGMLLSSASLGGASPRTSAARLEPWQAHVSLNVDEFAAAAYEVKEGRRLGRRTSTVMILDTADGSDGAQRRRSR